MLQPQRKNFKKDRKGRIKGFDYKKNTLAFGTYGIQSLNKGRITSRQIEATRRKLTGYLQRRGKVWIRIFPDHSITNKPGEVRMGKGKGAVSYWVANVKPGTVLFEVVGPNDLLVKEALKIASIKLPVNTRIIGPIV